VPLTETFKGVMPFLASDFLRIAAAAVLPDHFAVPGQHIPITRITHGGDRR
jgi:hypothetical protein